jgi:CheY-like chemotaxis protein
MPQIVVIDDDEAIRTLIAASLRFEGYEVLEAEDGARGLALVRDNRPALVVSDVSMPVMDGFAMLQALRSEPAIQATPVILLTSLQERADVRAGMSSGADDYLTKPIVFEELLAATATQLNKRRMRQSAHDLVVGSAITEALRVQEKRLGQLYEKRLLAELADKWPSAQSLAGDQKFSSASVLFVDVVNFPLLSEKLTSTELSEVVRQFYKNAGDTLYLFGAFDMHFVGEGLLAVFVDTTDTDTVKHGLRAMRAALGLIDSAQRVQVYLNTHFADRALPRFEVCVALGCGVVTVTRLEDPLWGRPQTLPVGDAVSTTLQLQKQAMLVGWKIAASAAMLRQLGGAVEVGKPQRFALAGRRRAMDAAEVHSLSPRS